MLRSWSALLALALVPACRRPATVTAASAPAAAPLPAGGEVWSYREVMTSNIIATWRLATYRLERAGDQVTLTVDHATARADLPTARLLHPWAFEPTRRLTGTATLDGEVLRLTLRSHTPATWWRWRCTLTTRDIAPADATRIRIPELEECGNEGLWSSPPAPAEVLVCTDARAPDDELGGELVFGRDPGIEHLYVHDGCFQGGGHRHIPRGGALAPFRGD